MWGFAATIALGLIAGSFLNVVIYRGPALWGLVGADRRARGDFLFPRSRCPACGTQIRAVDLAPLIGFMNLRGRCRTCSAAISWRYPAVELLGAAACAGSYAAFGLSAAGALSCVFLLGLIALAAIDFETGYLPEALTLPLTATGLAANGLTMFTDLWTSLIGAIVGYLSFAAISFAYQKLRGRDGLGLGDAALFAAIGAWGGWPILAPTAFLASLIALATLAGGSILSGRPLDLARPAPFGPALAAAAAILFFVQRDPEIAALIGAGTRVY